MVSSMSLSCDIASSWILPVATTQSTSSTKKFSRARVSFHVDGSSASLKCRSRACILSWSIDLGISNPPL